VSGGLLNTRDHARDAAGLTYVYPVVSRRAGGVSIGINLNPNNACDWRCIYCQVPNLARGTAPEIDLKLLEEELDAFLKELLHGPFMQERVPEECRRLCDIAISGNGEPTSCRDLAAVIEVIGSCMRRYGLAGKLPLRLITNGSYIGKGHVQQGLRLMRELNGEVWIKIDTVLPETIRRTNGVSVSAAQLRRQVETAAGLCPTWIQSCMYAYQGVAPATSEIDAYLAFLDGLQRDRVEVQGVLLYGVARTPMLPEGKAVTALDDAWMRELAERIRARGWSVTLSL